MDKRGGCCGWEIGQEKWKERYGGKIVGIACEKHLWIRGIDAAVRKYVKKSGRSAMEDKSWK